MSNRYEAAIVGDGPAGLTEAIHLAWYGRKAVVIDRRTGPLFFTLESLDDVPDVPAEVAVAMGTGNFAALMIERSLRLQEVTP